MKLYATLKNERGGKKSTSDDTRLLVELSYKNKVVGTVGLYSVWDKDGDLGYRVVWSDERGYNANNVIREEVKSSGNIVCECGERFYGLEGKEDTCPKCLKSLIVS